MAAEETTPRDAPEFPITNANSTLMESYVGLNAQKRAFRHESDSSEEESEVAHFEIGTQVGNAPPVDSGDGLVFPTPT